MNREKYLEILKTFIPSGEMREYLAAQDLSDRKITEIILGAPVSLTTKLQYVTGEAYEEIKQAIDNLKLHNDEHFYLFDNWYDEELFDYQEYPNRLSYDFNDVLEHIRNEILECGEEYDETSWYTLRKVVRDKNKTDYISYICVYEYTLIKDEVCYFTKNIIKNNTTEPADYRYGESTDLNLPVPFKVGDIVNIDCRPFAPVQQVRITETGDNHDCCSLQAEFYDKKEKEYKTGAVKHCFIFTSNYRPYLSPLYKIETYDSKEKNNG